MNPHFKKPLKVSVIVFVVGLLLVIAGATFVFMSDISDRKKEERASLLGGGLGVAMVLVSAPFWFAAAAKVGKERRERRG